MWRIHRLPRTSYLMRAVGACGLLVVGYFLVPIEPAATGTQLVVRSVLTAAIAVVVAMVIGRLVVHLIRGKPGTRPATLVVALLGGVVLSALVDYVIAISDPGQFEELETRVDALYFAVSTLATVGYGDVSASGQLARAVVTVQQLFNLAVLATGGTVLVNRIIAGASARRPDRRTRRQGTGGV